MKKTRIGLPSSINGKELRLVDASGDVKIPQYNEGKRNINYIASGNSSSLMSTTNIRIQPPQTTTTGDFILWTVTTAQTNALSEVQINTVSPSSSFICSASHFEGGRYWTSNTFFYSATASPVTYISASFTNAINSGLYWGQATAYRGVKQIGGYTCFIKSGSDIDVEAFHTFDSTGSVYLTGSKGTLVLFGTCAGTSDNSWGRNLSEAFYSDPLRGSEFFDDNEGRFITFRTQSCRDVDDLDVMGTAVTDEFFTRGPGRALRKIAYGNDCSAVVLLELMPINEN